MRGTDDRISWSLEAKKSSQRERISEVRMGVLVLGGDRCPRGRVERGRGWFRPDRAPDSAAEGGRRSGFYPGASLPPERGMPHTGSPARGIPHWAGQRARSAQRE
ncbi:hypothetical protein GCM10011612_11840 [Actinomyces gaoshouyii]|uniref:Uncharacterized protein n=1 Tax=Actinomyces gaoshouyii TaxID=1960083 RepID=A0A8H9LJ44_9ACTO|nr:hypothetical protein GCM10011612_11840 [Actinomyces gaoshouyii]